MLNSLSLSSFKCFERLELPLGALTLLSGVNGGGKSSVIQALVLLAQTLDAREWGRSLLLDGPDLALGGAVDVLNQGSTRRRLSLGASTDIERVQWTFGVDDRRSPSLHLVAATFNGIEMSLEQELRWLLPPAHAERSEVVRTLRRLAWISAERTGPRELLPLRDADSHRRVGSRGELVAGLLYWREDQRVFPALCVEGVPDTLLHQVRAWMQLFFPGCDLRVSPVDGTSTISLRLRLNQRSEFQRPQNVGFGVTQLLPIVVAMLSAKADDLLLVENPEVHLHPRAQQVIGRLLARVAHCGVQVIAETHSDHVLNGIRLAVKARDIPPSDVAMHFFAPDQHGGPVVPVSPKVDADGRIDAWPDGFFDQLDLALAHLL